MSELTALLAETSLFSLLDDDERQALAQKLEARHYDAGTPLFSRGDPGGSLYLVRRGQVRIFLRSHMGEEIELGLVAPGGVFGEVTLFDGGPRTADAVATADTEVLILDRDHLMAFLSQKPHAALDLLAVMGRRMRDNAELLRDSVTRNLNEEQDERMTFGQHVADRVATFGGSWTFILLFIALLFAWMGMNVFVFIGHPFDPYPFILLNLILSTLAAIQAPLIMMSQNRQVSKDRLKADLDYQTNLRAELEIAQLHRKVDRLHEILQAHVARSEGRAAVAKGGLSRAGQAEPARAESPH